MMVKARTLEKADFHIIWRETVNFIDLLAAEVREGKNVMLASQYALWVNGSGLIKLFEAFPCSDRYLTVSAPLLQKKLDDLLYECGEQFRGGKHDPKYLASDIAEINRKLDFLLESFVVSPVSVEAAGSCDLQLSLLFFKTTPVLKVFSSEPDGMPPFEAWWLKIIFNIQLPELKHRFLYQFRGSPCPKVCYPLPKTSCAPRCLFGSLYA